MVGPCRIVVMASGNGSNFQALIDAVKAQTISNSQIVRLIVDRKKAYAVTRAENVGVPYIYFNMISEGFQAKEEKDPEKLKEARSKYDAALAELVLQDTVDLVILAGWTHVFTSSFLQAMRINRVPVINLHPALPGELPRSISGLHCAVIFFSFAHSRDKLTVICHNAGAYDGVNAIERAFRDFQEGKLVNNRTGLMIHYVIEEVDRGEPILVQEIECKDGEDLHQLQERFHAQEHELIVNATAKVVSMLMVKEGKGPDNNE